MLEVRVEKISPTRVIIDMHTFEALIERAKKVEKIETDEILNDLPIEGIMKLVEEGGSLDFLKDEKEDVYTVADLKVRYK